MTFRNTTLRLKGEGEQNKAVTALYFGKHAQEMSTERAKSLNIYV